VRACVYINMYIYIYVHVALVNVARICKSHRRNGKQKRDSRNYRCTVFLPTADDRFRCNVTLISRLTLTCCAAWGNLTRSIGYSICIIGVITHAASTGIRSVDANSPPISSARIVCSVVRSVISMRASQSSNDSRAHSSRPAQARTEII